MAKGSRDEAAEAAVAVAEEELANRNQDEMTLRNGVVLKIYSVPAFLMQEAARKIPEPEVPINFLEDKGREEENPNDPTYLAKRARWESDTNEAAMNVAYLKGTAIVTVPEGMFWPHEQGWIDELEALGYGHLVSATNERQRYLQWLKLYAFDHADDLAEVFTAISRKSGVLESEAAKSNGDVRNNEGRDPDPGI